MLEAGLIQTILASRDYKPTWYHCRFDPWKRRWRFEFCIDECHSFSTLGAWNLFRSLGNNLQTFLYLQCYPNTSVMIPGISRNTFTPCSNVLGVSPYLVGSGVLFSGNVLKWPPDLQREIQLQSQRQSRRGKMERERLVICNWGHAISLKCCILLYLTISSN